MLQEDSSLTTFIWNSQENNVEIEKKCTTSCFFLLKKGGLQRRKKRLNLIQNVFFLLLENGKLLKDEKNYSVRYILRLNLIQNIFFLKMEGFSTKQKNYIKIELNTKYFFSSEKWRASQRQKKLYQDWI